MRRFTLFTVSAWLGLTAVAGAQATTTATPSAPGKATALHFDVDATLPPVSGKIPKGLEFTAPAGYKVDLQAVAKRCKQLQATLDECPAKSRIGKGSLVIQVTQPTQVRDVTVPLDFYLQTNKRVLAVAFLAGTRVIPGTISRTGGMALTFDPLPDPPAFPQVSYLLKRVTVDVRATRKVVTRRKGRKRTVVRSFIRNPAKCPSAGSWATSITFSYTDAVPDVLAAPVTCR